MPASQPRLRPRAAGQQRDIKAGTGQAAHNQTQQTARRGGIGRDMTPAGEQLLEDVPRVLAASAAATRRVHRSARSTRRLVIGFAPGLSVSDTVRAFRQANPGIDVDMQRLNWYEQGEALRDGRVDVGYVRRPFDGGGIRCIPVGNEPVVACLPAAHPLSSKPCLTAGDLDEETVLDSEVRRATTVEEKFELVAARRGIVCLPRSVAEYYSPPGLVCLPLADTPPHELCVAVIKNRRQQYLREFVKVAVAVLAALPGANSNSGEPSADQHGASGSAVTTLNVGMP